MSPVLCIQYCGTQLASIKQLQSQVDTKNIGIQRKIKLQNESTGIDSNPNIIRMNRETFVILIAISMSTDRSISNHSTGDWQQISSCYDTSNFSSFNVQVREAKWRRRLHCKCVILLHLPSARKHRAIFQTATSDPEK